MKNIYTTIALMALMLAALMPGAALAETDITLDPELEALLEGQEDVNVYEFPEIEPEASAALGFKVADHSGMRSIMRFGELDDTVLFQGKYRAFRFPHRYYIIYDHEGTKSYFGELRYAYSDIVFFRWVGSGVYRNPESVEPLDLDTSTSFPGVSVRDRTVEYGISKNTEDIFLRFKHPDYASHLFVRSWMVHEDGTIQERSLLGSGWFNEITRDVNKREYDWETHENSVGVNSHLGPAEVELEHRNSQFKMNSDDASRDYYTANVYRPAGFYDHHLYSGSTAKTNSIKVHSSFTGKVVASGTFANTKLTNDYSNVEADYSHSSAGLTWMPRTSLTLFLRYSHTDMDYDGVLSARLGALTYAVDKPDMSSKHDDTSLTARFRPIKDLVLRASVKTERIKRENALDWGLSSDATTKTQYAISARSSQIKKLGIKAEYIHTDIKDPAYNTEPDSAHKMRASADWRATPRTLVFLSASTEASKRHALFFNSTGSTDNRVTYRDSAMLGLTYSASAKMSLTGAYDYYFNSVKQDLVYDLGGSPAVSPDSVYEDMVHSISLNLNYVPSEKLTTNGGLSYASTKGSFKTHNQDLSQPQSIASIINKEFTVTALTLGGIYELAPDMGLDFEYMYKELSEELYNPFDALQDSDLQVVTAKVSKKW